MTFKLTYDNVLYLYPYYSMSEKNDEMSKRVYHVFKKDWDTHLPEICEDLHKAAANYFSAYPKNSTVAVTVMPSHSRGMYGANLLSTARYLSNKFNWTDESTLIQRVVNKTKSTDGGQRTVMAHLQTLELAHTVNKNFNFYIIIDDITTTGSSLEAARQLLISNGVAAGRIIKMAVAKTMHDDLPDGYS